MIFVDAGNTEYLKLSESKINTSGLFKLTTFSDGNGYINPSRRYFPKQSEIMITAYPDEGYQFFNWSGDLSGTKNPVKLTMDSEKKIQAKFIKIYCHIKNHKTLI